MSAHATSPFPLSFTRSSGASRPVAAVVPMYTPLWYATRVMSITASSWWEGGVPPARRRSRRAADAVANAAVAAVAAVGAARRLHVVRSAAHT